MKTTGTKKRKLVGKTTSTMNPTNKWIDHQHTELYKLDVWEEKGKVFIRKMSNSLGVVELNKKEVRELASILYKIVVKKKL